MPTDEAAIACYRDFLLSDAASDCPLPVSTDEPQVMIERTLNSLASDDVDGALRRIWDLAGDTFKYYYRHDSLDEFIKDAKQTSDEFATSFYGMAITGKRWTVLRPFTVAGSCVEINQCVGCTRQLFTKSFPAMARPSWLGRAVGNRHRHAIEHASCRWRGGRRDDSARTRRKILISTQAGGPDGWIGTCVVETVARDDRKRKWIWELRKRRRPPRMGEWYIESIGSSDADGTFDVA